MNPADLLPAEILEEDPLLDSAAQLEQTARFLDLEDWIVQRLKHTEREISVTLPLLRDSGETTLSAGIRVQHFRSRAGSLGPVVLAPDAHIVQLRPLALHLSLQCALLDLPFGGAAGAIVCDPAQLSERELRHLVRDYLAALGDLRADIFAPLDYAAAWTKNHHHLDATAIVGKPEVLGGLPDPAAAIASGWFAIISEALRSGVPRSSPGLAKAGNPELLSGMRIALQGFSAAAADLAGLLHGAGARLIAIADKSGALYSERGLDLGAVSVHVARHGMLYGFAAAEPVQNSDLLETDCDLLITAAAPRQINAQNAARVRAPLTLEAVYNAVTPAALRLLESRDRMVIPALLGSAPQALAWFAEWQHALHYSIPEQAAVEDGIRRRLEAVCRRVQLGSKSSRSASWAASAARCSVEKLSANLRLTQ